MGQIYTFSLMVYPEFLGFIVGNSTSQLLIIIVTLITIMAGILLLLKKREKSIKAEKLRLEEEIKDNIEKLKIQKRQIKEEMKK